MDSGNLSSKYLCRLLLVFLAALLVVPTFAAAASRSVTVANKAITIADTQSEITRSNDSTVSINAVKSWSFQEETKTNTITVTNTSGSKATIRFNYGVSGASSFSIGGGGENTGTSYAVELDKDQTFTISLSVHGRGFSSATATLTMTNITLEPISDGASISVNYESDKGVVKSGSDEVASGTALSVTSDGVNLTASSIDGAEFLGWVNTSDNKILSRKAEYTLIPVDGLTSVTAVFAKGSPWFFVDSGNYLMEGWNSAVEKTGSTSDKVFVPAYNATLPAGTYTVPQGYTLLIPFDDSNTVYTTEPGYVQYDGSTPTQYRQLTMASGASIVVNGAISIGGKQLSSSASTGHATGPYGRIAMQKGSSMTISNGGALYAWGFITGSGTITAENGSNVYEYFQIADWRGGSATYDMRGNRQGVFPLSQYYIQNIETPLTLEYGAQEYTYATFTASALGNVQTIGKNALLMGRNGSNALFELDAGSRLVKAYDPSTDRMTYDLYGDAALNHIKLSFKVLMSVEIDSADYVLPINGNISLNIHSGTTTCPQNIELLPGVQITVDEGATLAVGSSKALYVYDQKEWFRGGTNPDAGGGYAGSSNSGRISVVYSPTKAKTRGYADMPDAMIDVNGTLSLSGALYTTEGGADIKSSEGTGKVVLTSDAGTATKTYQATQSGSNITYVDIPITSAQLHNGAASSVAYTQTAGAAAGATYTYYPAIGTDGNDYGMWATQAVAQIGNGTEYTQYASLQGAVMAYDGTGTIQMINPTTEPGFDFGDKTVHLDLNGKTVNLTSDLTCGENGILYGMDSQTDDYVGENAGKLAGTISCNLAKVYQTPDWEDNGKFNRYLAVQTTDGWTFHRFNISITGYNIAFTSSGQGALQFIAKFEGDSVVQSKVTKVGFVFNGDQADMEIAGPATGTPQTYTSPNALVGTVTAENYKDLCQAKAYLIFENGSQDSVNRETTFLRALKTCYYKDGTLTNADGGNGNATVEAFLKEANTDIQKNWDEILVLP